VLVQLVQTYEVGDPLQLAVSVRFELTTGDVVLGETVQTGGAVGGDCQLTDTCTDGLLPLALVAMTEYTFGPALAAESMHDDVVEEHPVQVYDVGLSVHVAVIVTFVPSSGDGLLADSEQDGTGGPTDCQFTTTVPTGPVPMELLAETV